VFNRLFARSDSLTRQRSGPLVDERRNYLCNCEEQGMSKSTLRTKARTLLSIANYLKLAHRTNDQISFDEIEKLASRWSQKKYPSPSKRSREEFISEIGRL
jgi:hypothetical protein